jgi:Ca2+-binding RTX toxin-like protein
LWLIGAVAALALLVCAPAALAAKCGGKKVTISTKKKKVKGTNGNDVIDAGSGKDKIQAKGGDDIICGGKGADIINAGAGNDTILGGGGGDNIDGGDGDDNINGEKGSDRGTGGAGNDTIIGDSGSEDMTGGDGDDSLDGGDSNDTLNGGNGNDFINGQRGGDILHGDGGSDQVFGDRENDKVFGDESDGDLVDGGLGDDDVDAGAGNQDTATGGLGIDNVDGGPGDRDTVRGDIGTDKIDGGPGSQDIVSFIAATPLGGGTTGVNVNLATGVASGDGNDTITGVEDAIGSAYADTITGNSAANRLDGGPGDDVINGGGPHGTFFTDPDQGFGGSGSDDCKDVGFQDSCGASIGCPATSTCVERVTSIDGSTSLSIIGSGQNDNMTLSYGGGNYVLTEAAHPVVDFGGTCTVTTVGAGAKATCPGPPALAALVLSGGNGNDTITVDGSVPASSPAKINGEDGNDTLQGGVGSDLIDAGKFGNDILNGGPGSDGIVARFGKDEVNGQGGNDLVEVANPCEGSVMSGGDGTDNASFAPAVGYRVNATLGGTAVDPSQSNCIPTRIDGSNEALEGTAGADILRGDGGNNSLYGQGGDDQLYGEGGNDLLNGVAGSDELYGGTGKDELRAIDGAKDKRLDCGPPKNFELAQVDPQDPKPTGCGKVSKKKKKKKKKKGKGKKKK